MAASSLMLSPAPKVDAQGDILVHWSIGTLQVTLVVNYELPCQWNQVNMERMGMGQKVKTWRPLCREIKIHPGSYFEVKKLYREVIQIVAQTLINPIVAK